MTVPKQVSKKLQQTMGEDAGRTAQQIADTFKWAVPVWLASLGAIIGVMTWLMRGTR